MKILQKIRRFKPYIAGVIFIILGKSGKQPQNQQAVINILREKYE